MELVCAVCGKRMIAPDDLQDGQHVRCPHCGDKSTYSKPCRIELPPVAVDVPRSEPQAHADETNDNAVETIQHNSGLGRLVIPVVVAVVALAAGGICWYWQERQEAKLRVEVARAEAEKARAVEAAEVARAENARRVAAEKAEREKQQRLEREVAEKKLAEEKARVEAEKARIAKAEEAKRVKRENEIQENIAAYKGFLACLRENEFDLFFSGVTNEVVQNNGLLVYFLQTEERPVPLHIVEFSNGVSRVTCLTADGRRHDVGDISQFQERLSSLDYLVADERKTYYRARRKKCRTGRLSPLEDGNPADAFFGSLAAQVKELNPVFDVLSFEIVFLPKGKQQREILCDTVEYGCSYSAKKVREEIEDAFPCRVRKNYAKTKPQKFKRSVKFWNGTQVKRGIDGITYVPRIFPTHISEPVVTVHGSGWNYRYHGRHFSRYVYRNGLSLSTWTSLYNQAQAEDAAEAQFHQDLEESRLKEMQDLSETARTAWENRIDRMLKEGVLYYRIKKEKAATPSASAD